MLTEQIKKVILNKKDYKAPLVINQYDREIPYIFELLQPNGTIYTLLATDIVKIEIMVGNVAIIISGSDITKSSNKISFKLKREIALNSGSGTYNVVIENNTDNSRVSSFKGEIIIESNSIDETTVPTALIVTAMENLNTATNEAITTEESLRSAIASGDLANYQLKETGKGLSSNDFTSAYKALLDNIFEKIYPVGSYYQSDSDINPSILFGIGTWERIKGRVLVGLDESDTDFDTVGEVGGEKKHILTESELPQENVINPTGGNLAVLSAAIGSNYVTGYTRPWTIVGNELELATKTVGGNVAHNNLQPYKVVYIWHRII